MKGLESKHQLFDYFVRIAHLLQLDRWELEFEEGEPEGIAGPYATDADIQVNVQADIATIRFGEHLLTNEKIDPEYLRRVVIHESLHCILGGTRAMVRHDLEEVLGAVSDAMFWRTYDRQSEREIDALTRMIAPHYPLIGDA